VASNAAGDAIHWLWLSDESNPNLTNLFSGVHIPVDSNVWSAAPYNEEEQIVLEVWRVAQGLPLKTNIVAAWSQLNGFQSTIISKWERRTDLTGLFIEGGTQEVTKTSLLFSIIFN